MGKKKGKAVKAVPPATPDKANDADLADPGKMAEIIAEQLKKKTGKYGSTPAKPFKPSTQEQVAQSTEEDTQGEEKEELSWIEIELIDEEDEPVSGEKYEITLPDNTVIKGSLDGEGFARHDGIPKGTCKVTFPDLDEETWENK